METVSGRDTVDVLNRPWRWWNEAARAANSRGQDELTGRIFLFTHLFVSHLAPKMNVGSELETGLGKPQEHLYKDIAVLTVDSMSKLDPNVLIHNTATGKVDVTNVILMAREVSGVSSPAGPVPESQVTPTTTDGSQWNTL
jgi:hypothetical protein